MVERRYTNVLDIAPHIYHLGLVQQIRRKHGDGVMGLDEPRRGQTFNVLHTVGKELGLVLNSLRQRSNFNIPVFFIPICETFHFKEWKSINLR